MTYCTKMTLRRLVSPLCFISKTPSCSILTPEPSTVILVLSSVTIVTESEGLAEPDPPQLAKIRQQTAIRYAITPARFFIFIDIKCLIQRMTRKNSLPRQINQVKTVTCQFHIQLNSPGSTPANLSSVFNYVMTNL